MRMPRLNCKSELLNAGRGAHHSRDLGENLRKDLLLLNKDLFSDVKVYSSSERRVIATTDVFLRAFLEVDQVPTELVTIRKDMLDDSFGTKELTDSVKGRLQGILNGLKNQSYVFPKEIENPAQFAQEIIDLLRSRRNIMKRKFETLDLDQVQKSWCCSESPVLFKERWERLFRDFCDVERSLFDPSKVPELYDSLKYDALHNRDFIECVFVDQNEQPDPKAPLRELYKKAKMLADFVGPREYGISDHEKLELGFTTSLSLLKQLVNDFEYARTVGHPYTRFYFTKESHVHTLYNAVRLCLAPNTFEIHELDYLTQITFEVYERFGFENSTEYTLRISFSPGAHDPGLIDTVMDDRHALAVAPRKWLTEHLPLDDALKQLKPRLNTPIQSPRITPKLKIREKLRMSSS